MGAYAPSGEQVGFARMVTDLATFAWLCDVFVDPAWRRHGIATALVRALLDHPELATVRRWSLGTRDAHAIYRALGFEDATPGVMMQKLGDARRWADPAAGA